MCPRHANGQSTSIGNSKHASITVRVNQLMRMDEALQHGMLPVLTRFGELNRHSRFAPFVQTQNLFEAFEQSQVLISVSLQLFRLMTSLILWQRHPPVHGNNAQISNSLLDLSDEFPTVCCVSFFRHFKHMTTT